MKSDQSVSLTEIFAGLSSYLKFSECESIIRNSLYQKQIIVLIKEKCSIPLKLYNVYKHYLYVKINNFCSRKKVLILVHSSQTDKNILQEQNFLLNITINRFSIPKINVSGVQIQQNIDIRGKCVRTSQNVSISPHDYWFSH